MIIQIYAFTEIDQAVEAAEISVDHIGFVAGKYNIVHGELSFAKARRMVDALPENVRSSALTMSTNIDEILRMADEIGPDIIHISTDIFAIGLEKLYELKKKLPADIKIMKALPVQGDSSITIAEELAAVCNLLLLDTKVDTLPGVGATGRTHDWKISRQIVKQVQIPVILAGGLTPENVADAIRIVQPSGVDSNTATNIRGSPVEKDMLRIRQFVESVRPSSLEKN